MRIFDSFFRKPSASDYLVKGLAALKMDRWDDALTALYEAEGTFQRSGSPERAGLSASNLLTLLVALSILDAASGKADQAVERLQLGLKSVPMSSALRKFLEGLVRQIQHGPSAVPPSPYTVGGQVVPLELYVSKEVLMSAVLEGTLDEEGSFDRDAVMERARLQVTVSRVSRIQVSGIFAR